MMNKCATDLDALIARGFDPESARNALKKAK